jgi:hypothetical protein
LTRSFQVRSKLFVSSFCQSSRESLSLLGVEEIHIAAIDLLAFICGRIRARNVETPVLHKVVIGIAAAGLSPGRKPRVALRHPRTAFLTRQGFGLDLLDAFFKIVGKLRR